MKKTLLGLALAFAATTFAAAPTTATDSSTNGELRPLQQQLQAAAMTANFLTRFHYKTVPLDDAMSSKIFDRYLKSLDPEKLFFIQADIDKFADARTKMDDAINNQDLSTPFSMFKIEIRLK